MHSISIRYIINSNVLEQRIVYLLCKLYANEKVFIHSEDILGTKN